MPRSLLALLLILTALLPSCAGASKAPEPAQFDAEGTYVCHLRLRLAPSHTQDFERLMRRCVSLADEDEWLCYLESPGRYWLVYFADGVDGFVYPTNLSGFVQHLGTAAGRGVELELQGLLDGLELTLEWELLLQQKASWSTVEDMSTATHPMARLMVRTMRPGMEVAFERALQARTAFLAEHGYPLPIEGFVVRRGDLSQAMQATFPRDWSSFHAADSFGAFVKGLSAEEQADYAKRKAALMQTMSRAEFHDARFMPELSFSGD